MVLRKRRRLDDFNIRDFTTIEGLFFLIVFGLMQAYGLSEVQNSLATYGLSLFRLRTSAVFFLGILGLGHLGKSYNRS